MSSDPGADLCRAVVITALQVEFTAVCEHLDNRREEVHPQGTIYEKGTFRTGIAHGWEITVAEIGAGNVNAAAEVERAIGHCRPDVVLFVGIAGGIKDVEIGDVVAGTKVYGYESGKESNGFKARPTLHESTYRMIQRAKAEARSGNWRQRIRTGRQDATPRALVGPIAAGEKVVADAKSATAQLIAETYGDALAVEMEGYGFLHGVSLHQGLSALVIRGISDRLDGKADADKSGSQELASRHASAFCFEILAKLGTCPRNGSSGIEPAESEPGTQDGRLRTPLQHESGFKAVEEVAGFPANVEITVSSTVDARYVTEMNSVRDLLNDGHAHAALQILQSLKRAAREQDFDDDFLFRLETNLGAAALVLGKFDVAEPHFEEALRLKPEDPKASANLAQLAIIRGQPPVAWQHASRAWSLVKDDPYVSAVYLRALKAVGTVDEVRETAHANQWMQSDAQCALALAIIEFGEGQYSRAEELAKASLRADPKNPQTMEFLGRCIMVPLQTELDQNPPLPGKVPEEVLMRAIEAESLFGQAVSMLENQDHKEMLIAAIANRGMVLSLLGRDTEAGRDYDHALALNPDQTLVKVNKARLLLKEGNPNRAVELLDSLDAEEKLGAWHPLALAYLETQQPKKALQVLEAQWRVPLDRLHRIKVAELLLSAYSTLPDHEAAAEIANTLEAELPDDPEAIAAAAEWRASQPDGYDRAIQLFLGALDRATDARQKDRINLSLAGLYYKNRHFGDSAELYGKLLPYFDHPGVFRRYLLSLFYSGSRREALKVAADRRAGGTAIPLISEVEAHLLAEAGDLEGASRLLAELIEIEPDEPEHRISLATLQYRRGDYDGSKRALLGVGVDEVKGNAQQMFALARTRAWLGLDGVLELAYRARRVGFDDPAVHQAYVSLFLHRRREQDQLLNVTRAGPGATVHLKAADGHTKVFTIVDGLDADLYRGEVLPSDPVALKLAGYVVDQSITLSQTELETVTFQITKVESQYVYAFQETLLNFSTWFPEESEGIGKLTVDAEGVDKMLQMIRRRDSHIESALALYRANKITLGMLAQLIGHSVVALWSALQDGGDVRIASSTGQEEEARAEATLLNSGVELVLDLVGLLTFASLGLLPKLKERFKLVTTQFVADEISDELTMDRVRIPSSGSFSRRGDQYVLEPAPAIETGEKRIFLENIADFLKRDVDLRPTPELLV